MQQVGPAANPPRPAPHAPGPHRPLPPAPSAARRVSRRPPRARLSIVSKLGLAALTGIVAFAFATGGGREARSFSLMAALDKAALALGYGIDQVEIEGHQHTPDAAIHDTLDLANAGSLLSLDSAAIRGRIERLPWIETATVTRVFPDRLRIEVRERKPYARWQRGEQVYLVDRTGRVLTPIRPGAAAHLPLVAGEGAAEAAEPLLALLERYPEIFSRLETAERIDARRWTLQLEGGPRLHLPADGEAEALSRIAAAGVLQGAAAMSAASVDARLSGRMTVGREAPARTTAAPACAQGPQHPGRARPPGPAVREAAC